MTGYRLIKQIGKGGTGVVYLAWHERLRKYVVLKEIMLGTTDPDFLRHEADVLKNLHHTYLPQVYDFFSSEGKTYMVEDYIEGRSLEDIISTGMPVPENRVVIWLKQLCQVLSYLHGRNPVILHSDIKPGNIMITPEGNVCLIDFNIAMRGTNAGLVRGFTRGYSSPEQAELTRRLAARMDTGGIKLTPASDIYSLAATFYTVLTFNMPPEEGVRVRLASAQNNPYSRELRIVLDKAMDPHPSKRYKSASEMENALDHLDRLSPLYQTYRRLRIAVTAAGIVLMAAGGLMVYGGRIAALENRFNQTISGIEHHYAENGASKELNDEIETFLSDDSFRGLLSGRGITKAQMLGMEAECFFNEGTAEGYENAASYYRQAMEMLRTEDPDSLQIRKFAGNAARSLVMCGRKEEGLALLSDYPDAEEKTMISMQILFAEGDYEELLKMAASADIASLSVDNRLAAADMAAKAAAMTGDHGKETAWREQAVKFSNDDYTKRQLMYACLNATVADKAYYSRAEEAYKSIAEPTEEDSIYYGIILYGIEKYSRSLDLLNSITPESKVLLCRRNLYLALDYAELNDYSHAKRCTKEASGLFDAMTEQEKAQIDTGMLEAAKKNFGMGEE